MRRPTDRSGHPDGADREAGFSLIELMTAMTLIGIVMASLTGFFTNALRTTNALSNSQTAVQLVSDSLERVRSLRGSSVATGRDSASVQAQWAAVPTGSPVAPYLDTMQPAWDATALLQAGKTAPLPTEPELPITLNDVPYTRTWYVGQCWQPPLGGECTTAQTSGSVLFYRVVTLITWRGTGCPANTCSQVAATLVNSASTDPVFNAKEAAQAPQVVNPGPQAGEVTVPFQLSLAAIGGAPPLIWSATNLPPGLTMSSDGNLVGTPTSAGTYTVVASATDGFGLVGSAAFTVAVAALPVIADPRTIATKVGTAATPFTPTVTGGTAPFTWAATDLPTGLTINAATGTITGTPTTVGTKTVTLTLTDTYGKTDTRAFTWIVATPPVLSNPGAKSSVAGTATTVTPAVTGGTAPFTWAATGLPAGLTVDAKTGTITGTPTTVGTKTVTLTVTDAYGWTDTATFTWAVTPALGVATPADQNTLTNTAATSVQIVASGGVAPYRYSATAVPSGVQYGQTPGLPPGLTLDPASGVISGKPTLAGEYVVRVTVTDAAGKTVYTQFVWAVGPYVKWPREDQTGALGSVFTVPASAVGGTKPYTWYATNLPDGVSYDPATGSVTGTLAAAGRYVVTFRVTDAKGYYEQLSLICTVTTSTGLQITSASAPTARSTRRGQADTFTLSASGATGLKTWSATGLPPGMSINSNAGVVSGIPTAAGTYTTKITVTDSSPTPKKSNWMFVWTVT